MQDRNKRSLTGTRPTLLFLEMFGDCLSRVVGLHIAPVTGTCKRRSQGPSDRIDDSTRG
jgi:hypothetical protein